MSTPLVLFFFLPLSFCLVYKNKNKTKEDLYIIHLCYNHYITIFVFLPGSHPTPPCVNHHSYVRRVKFIDLVKEGGKQRERKKKKWAFYRLC